MNREPVDFKHADVGQAPSDWPSVELDDVAKRGSGHTPDKKHPKYWNGDIKWVSLRDSEALDKLFVAETAASITPAGIANSSAVVHPPGTVILSRDAGVGKSAILGSSMAVSQHFMAWQCSPKLDNVYLYYWLQHMKPEFERIAMGSTIKTIGLPYFQALRILLPPREEQRGIAAALRHVDECVEALQALIAKKRDLKQAAMQQLLTGRRRLARFVGDFASTRLGDVVEAFVGGGTPARSNPRNWGGPIPWMTVKDFATFNPSATQEYITREGLENSASRLIPRGTLIISTRMALGRAVVCDVDVAINQDLKAVFPNKCCDIAFLRHWFCYQANTIEKLGTGSTVMGLSVADLKALSIALPAKEEQAAIAKTLTDIDIEVQTLQARRQKVVSLKQAMMQQLLTGRIRLI